MSGVLFYILVNFLNLIFFVVVNFSNFGNKKQLLCSISLHDCGFISAKTNGGSRHDGQAEVIGQRILWLPSHRPLVQLLRGPMDQPREISLAA